MDANLFCPYPLIKNAPLLSAAQPNRGIHQMPFGRDFAGTDDDGRPNAQRPHRISNDATFTSRVGGSVPAYLVIQAPSGAMLKWWAVRLSGAS